MEKQLAHTEQHQLTPETIKTLNQAGIIPNNTPPAQIQLFANICAEKQLNPFTKEIYLVGFKDKYSVIVAIDGYRKIAGKTGLHAGTDDVKFDLMPDGSHKTAAMFEKGQKPKTATITVWKIVGGLRVPFTHTAVFSEFEGGSYTQWPKMPFQMISKVAEAFALKKAFPTEFAGIHVDAEEYAIERVSGGMSAQNTNTELPSIEEKNILAIEKRIREYDKPDVEAFIQAQINGAKTYFSGVTEEIETRIRNAKNTNEHGIQI